MYEIVRNLFPPYMAKFARQDAEMIIEHGDKVVLPEGAINVWKQQRGMRLVNPPSSIIDIAQAMTKIVGLPCDFERSSLRCQDVEPGWPRLPWHQDGAGMGLEDGQKAIVSWVPLDPIDGTRPTLEISANDYDMPLRPHERDENHFLEAEWGPSAFTVILKDLKPGDVVLFSPLTLHRTYFAEGMTNPRISLDLRFFGPTNENGYRLESTD